MKKILIAILLLSVQTSVFAASYVDKQLKEVKKNSEYNTVQKHRRGYNTLDFKQSNKEIDLNIKDPKLIKLSNITPVDKALYTKKLAEDENYYEKTIKPIINKNTNSLNIAPLAVDFYKVYRISEKLIRANNLDYVNWRISIRKSEEINAYAANVNSIVIYTPLYDSLYTDEDALAFVIAHEMAHQILGHTQRQAELMTKFSKLYNLTNISELARKKYIVTQLKAMEFMADTEALTLVTKAGYSPYKSVNALNFLDIIPGANVDQFLSDHPITKDRIKSAMENIYYINPSWPEEGKVNIFNSNVLPCKKSSDRVSIVISKSEKNKDFYQTEGIKERLIRLAYTSYVKGKMENAIKYFQKLSEVDNNYVVYLYLSYANEYMYNVTKEQKYMKNAEKAIEQAYSINSGSEYVQKQMKDLKSL